MKRLEGLTAIITGGAKGLGVHYARTMAQQGCAVVIADIVDCTAPAAALGAEFAGIKVRGRTTDVSREDSVRELVKFAVQELGHIDILVNNAAVFATLAPTDVANMDVEIWDKVMAVNVRGTFLMCKHVAPLMAARRHGKIVNITSGVAYKGMGGMAHYATSKGAITTFTRSLSKELGPFNVCVNNLAPGAIMSDTIVQNAAHMERYHTGSVASRAMRRDAYPKDLEGALLFLASGDSDFITGQTIAVDGGSIYT